MNCRQYKQIIDEMKIAFVHVPKTSGLYIENKMCLHAKKLNTKYIKFGGHYTYEQMHTKENIAHYTFFTIVRNPYDRIISAFNYYQDPKTDQHAHFTAIFNSENDINRFVNIVVNKKMYKNNPFFQSQYDWLNFNGKLPIIIKYEAFKEGMEYLTKFCDNPEATDLFSDLAKGHDAVRYDVRSHLNEKSIKAINTICESDFQYFRYKKIEC